MALNIELIIGLVLFWYMLSVLKRARVWSLYFWLGSIGAFILIAFFSHAYFVWLLSAIVTKITGMIGSIFGCFSAVSKTGLLIITRSDETIQMLVDYECSGVIEISAYLAIMIFYPLYNLPQKIKLSFLGVAYILLANIIRLTVIALIIYLGGSGLLFVAHSIIGRVLFYTLVIILYYNVFTRSQLIRLFKVDHEKGE